ncbi:hypothetical protein BGZ83_007027 [Gryganskiella cystojenkinii]|nr:hypothetical protein BGZ83_007027 [Gryganskiella cystojenkinii]
MSNPGTGVPGQGQSPGQQQQQQQGRNPAAFPLGMYPQPIRTHNAGQTAATATSYNNTASQLQLQEPSISHFPSSTGASTAFAAMNILTNPIASSLPPIPVTLSNTPPGTAPRKQLAAAAAAGAAAGSSSGSAGASGKSGRPKGPYKKGTGATGKRGGGGGGGSRGGRGGRGGGRGGGHASGSGRDGDDDDDPRGGSKDSDDDEDPEVSIEEQFIMRLPAGDMADRFREKVVAREIDESVILRFKDPRRGTFVFEGQKFGTKLVDLPTITESHKTLNGKQMYKIADISQLLLVDLEPEEDIIKTESSANLTVASAQTGSSSSTLPPLKPSEYIWPDGLTNPLKNVRKRRFRKRISKVAVEGVENEIERLLHEDALAEEVKYEIVEHNEGNDGFDSEDGATPAPDDGRPRAQSEMDIDDQDMDMEDEDEDEDDGSDMEDFLQTIEKEIEASEDEGTPQLEQQGSHQQQQSSSSSQLKQKQGSDDRHGLGVFGNTAQAGSNSMAGHRHGSSSLASGNTASKSSSNKGKEPLRGTQAGDEDEDEEEEEEDDEEDDEEEEEDDDEDDDDSGSDDDDDDDEGAQHEKLLKDEIKELTVKVKENEDKVNSAPNDILKRRFGSILENLRNELNLKTRQLEEAKAQSKAKNK